MRGAGLALKLCALRAAVWTWTIRRSKQVGREQVREVAAAACLIILQRPLCRPSVARCCLACTGCMALCPLYHTLPSICIAHRR